MLSGLAFLCVKNLTQSYLSKEVKIRNAYENVKMRYTCIPYENVH